MINNVIKMYSKFNISNNKLDWLGEKEKKFRISAMAEELQEYADASNKHDELDALIDLIIFALGTIERQGMSDIFEEAFNRVIDANMAKKLGPNTKRGEFSIDLVKPEGWVPPCFKDLMKQLHIEEKK